MYRLLEAAVAMRLLSGCHARCSIFWVRSGPSASAPPPAPRLLEPPRDIPKRLEFCTGGDRDQAQSHSQSRGTAKCVCCGECAHGMGYWTTSLAGSITKWYYVLTRP